MFANPESYSSLLGHFREAFGAFIDVDGEEAESLLKHRDNRGGRARLSANETPRSKLRGICLKSEK
jgi:hypothetical protein